MTTKKTKSEAPKKTKTLEHELEGGLSGAVAGAVFGAAAGPPGMAAGALIGGVAGALVGGALDSGAAVDAAHTSELDEAIGVTSAELGAPNLRHPPAKRGAYSVASVNGGAAEESDAAPAEGGIEPPADRG
jgi:phage tail tape-measure protein